MQPKHPMLQSEQQLDLFSDMSYLLQWNIITDAADIAAAIENEQDFLRDVITKQRYEARLQEILERQSADRIKELALRAHCEPPEFAPIALACVARRALSKVVRSALCLRAHREGAS